MTYKTVAETKVSDIPDIDIAQEVISAALYDFIENETDDLDKIMAQLIKN